MPDYSVAIYVKYPSGGEDRYDTTVHAEDEEDAVQEALEELPDGTKLKKVILVEER
jgi:hypothetical protein